ncbi:MAG: glutathione S-transferase [Pseudanabaena frigida]|uniref:Glutathione S-transferase n=1 Tax=Pseudanabaena frigida TaxID=945775 RepID=A0A2W4W7V7_9CYAN|nr:MAG: glutathione S-transferase [Pseudanabaena frigida]
MLLPILYSFRRCPYAIRARLALVYAGITYELREVSLKNKPQAMLDISPKGTTPVMQIFRQDGESYQNSAILEESLDIMNWAIQQNDPSGWKNLPETSQAIAQALITRNDGEFKQALDRYKYANRFPERAPEFYRQQAEEFLQVLELQLQKHSSAVSGKSSFLICDRQTLADVAIFPFVRQLAYVDIDWFQSSPYTHLQQWLKWHETNEIFEFVMQKFPLWMPDREAIVIKR